MKIIFNNKGYTLIELLAVIIVMVSVGTVITSIMVSALRGGNKSQTTNEVRESGNYVISQMSKMIAYGQTFCGLSVDNNEGTALGDCDVNGANESTYVTDCTTNPSQVYNYVRVKSFDGGKTIFSCPDVAFGTTTISSNSAAMLASSFTITNCSFVSTQPNSSVPPTIDISFTLSESSGVFTEKQAQIPFETSVTIRNIGD